MKTICNWGNSWAAVCWSEGEHLQEVSLSLLWFYTLSYIPAFDPCREAAKVQTVGLLQDAFHVVREANRHFPDSHPSVGQNVVN